MLLNKGITSDLLGADPDKPKTPNDFFASVFSSKVSRASVISGRVQRGGR